MINIQELFDSTEITIPTAVLRLGISFLCGMLIGVERQLRRNDAGMRTFTLICMGASLAMLVSIWIPQTFPNFLNGDPGRIAAQVLTGVGFLGAGAIIQDKGGTHGLTTAACIWVMSVIGLAIGAGMYLSGAIATLLTLTILVSLEQMEKKLYLDGVNKILSISCSTVEPDLDKIRKTIENENIYIVSFSYDCDYQNETSTIIYKVNVKSKASYKPLFDKIRAFDYISKIKLMS